MNLSGTKLKGYAIGDKNIPACKIIGIMCLISLYNTIKTLKERLIVKLKAIKKNKANGKYKFIFSPKINIEIKKYTIREKNNSIQFTIK